MENKEKEFEELLELAKPLQKWLANYYNPMCSIVINLDDVGVLSSEMGIPTSNE